MECNKEEAIKAKDLAEKKLQNKDFEGARKWALKAQQLYPNIENLSQLILVCNVHCSAEKKILGDETDWYGILQIEQTADEATIKKQYRKFALQLHPDKNKFAGAEAAFKLIGEAQRILLDQGKRQLHDMKRRSSVGSRQYSQRPSWTSSVNTQTNVRNNFTGVNLQQNNPQRPTHQGFPNGRPTFWTQCPHCRVKYQYYRDLLNRSLCCQYCHKVFVAAEIQTGSMQTTNRSHPAYTQQKNVPPVNSQGNVSNEKCKTETTQKPQPKSGKINSTKRKRAVHYSESSDADSSSDSEDDLPVDEDGNLHATQNVGGYGEPRRSTRQRQKVYYNEKLSDDEDVCSLKQAKVKGSSEEESPEMVRQEKSGNSSVLDQGMKNERFTISKECLPKESKETKKMEEKPSGGDDDKKSSKANDESPAPDVVYYQCPDPDFSDFDKDRREECFAAGQIWAIYDDFDAMPRFYALIKKVMSRRFRVTITWLEFEFDDERSSTWVGAKLPVSCGKFKRGDSETTRDRLMFSHQISWEEGNSRNIFLIYPRKGETWALFKDWDFSWTSRDNANCKYEYDFVEILSDFSPNVGIWVAHLCRVKGFACLFCRTEKDGRYNSLVSPDELLRFSHRVPSFKMTGEERQGVPKGSFELDPASLPIDFEKGAPEELEVKATNVQANPSDSRSPNEGEPVMGCKKDALTSQADVKDISADLEDDSPTAVNEGQNTPSSSISDPMEIPDPEFYNFDAQKSVEKFRVGQIWALYSDEDSLPKYYGQIKKIDTQPEVTLYISWLEVSFLPYNMTRWHDRKMPIGCGRFKIKTGKTQSYSSTYSFSHQVEAEQVGKRNIFDIFPRRAEIWALYKNWNADITCSDLENCEYDIVEVLDKNDSHVQVAVLERVDGFNAVFKTQRGGGSALTMQIPCMEMLRFSHQIPSFKLTDQRDGTLRGFWELDPAALPVNFFCSN